MLRRACVVGIGGSSRRAREPEDSRLRDCVRRGSSASLPCGAGSWLLRAGRRASCTSGNPTNTRTCCADRMSRSRMHGRSACSTRRCPSDRGPVTRGRAGVRARLRLRPRARHRARQGHVVVGASARARLSLSCRPALSAARANARPMERAPLDDAIWTEGVRVSGLAKPASGGDECLTRRLSTNHLTLGSEQLCGRDLHCTAVHTSRRAPFKPFTTHSPSTISDLVKESSAVVPGER